MTKTVTPARLRSKLQRITDNSYTGSGGLTGVRINTNQETEEITDKQKQGINTPVTVKKFQKIHHNTLILDDGSHATILQPIPCLKWKALAQPDSKGTMTLKRKLEATILTVGNEQICLGIRGQTDELEMILDMGDSEIRVNDNYVNIKTKHLIVNGKEVHK